MLFYTNIRIRVLLFEDVQCLSETDGGTKRSHNTGSSISLGIATTSTPVSFQKHEVIQWHHSARRVRLQSVEKVVAEREWRAECVIGRISFGKVRKQDDVTIGISVTVVERDTEPIYL